MSKLGDIEVSVNIKYETVELFCLNVDCQHNLAREGKGNHCNLKRLALKADGTCAYAQYEDAS